MLPNFIVNAQIKEWCSNPADPNCCIVDGVPTFKCLEVVFSNLLFISSAFIMLVLFIMLVVGSFNYMISLGNPEQIKKAQGTLKFAIVGFLLFISAFLILKTIDVLFLGGTGKIFKLEIP